MLQWGDWKRYPLEKALDEEHDEPFEKRLKRRLPRRLGFKTYQSVDLSHYYCWVQEQQCYWPCKCALRWENGRVVGPCLYAGCRVPELAPALKKAQKVHSSDDPAAAAAKQASKYELSDVVDLRRFLHSSQVAVSADHGLVLGYSGPISGQLETGTLAEAVKEIKRMRRKIGQKEDICPTPQAKQ